MPEHPTVSREKLEFLARKLTDRGLLIEAGWIGLRLAIFPNGASPEQLDEMRLAFKAGAMHLFTSIMSILEPGAEPTDKDLLRMDLINNELQAFGKELEARCHPEGNA